jgi:lipoyl(octanoyl) transferase
MRDWRLILGAGTAADPPGIPGAASPAPAPGARNMAVDHALLESVQQGGRPVLRLYRWDPPCLSFGRNQRACGIYDEARIRAAGVDVVRRPTGGLAVLHDRELTYCVLAPADALGGPRRAYHLINSALVAGLASLGVPAAVAGAGSGPDPIGDAAMPCFQAPAAGEVVAGGRKLVGSAQRCEGRTLLQHGSILLDGSQAAVLDMLSDAAMRGIGGSGSVVGAGGSGDRRGGASVSGSGGSVRARGLEAAAAAASGAVTLREILGSVPAWDSLVHAITAGFERVCGTPLAPDPLTRAEDARADRHEIVYAGAAWTWRR